jgi:hypothetical protein
MLCGTCDVNYTSLSGGCHIHLQAATTWAPASMFNSSPTDSFWSPGVWLQVHWHDLWHL